MVRLYVVDSIELALNKSEPPQLVVTAFGRAATSGWNNIALNPLEKKLSADGILDLEFVGDPPKGISLPMLVPAVAHYVWEDDVDRIIGVKVDARSNSLTELVATTSPFKAERGAFEGAKTLAIGEEHLTTLVVGEEGTPTERVGEGQPPITTFAIGEEHFPTTWRVGEEGTHFVGEGPTFHVGENGTTKMVGEETPSNFVAEHDLPWDPGDPLHPDPGDPPPPWANAFGFRRPR